MVSRFARGAALVLLVFALAACGEPPKLVPYDGAVSEIQPVLVATSRRAEGGNPPHYGGDRDSSLHFAEYRISIPPNRVPGKLHLPSGPPDPARDFLSVGYQPLENQAAFIAAVNRMLDPLPAQDRRVVLFVHGYKSGFANSVLRAAQLAEDYRLTGPMVAYSWPSADREMLYAYDRESTLYTRDQFVETLQALAKTRATSVVILAHSMGGFLVMEGMSRLRDRGDRATLSRISAVVLAEPDIDLDVFGTQLRGLDLRRMGIVVLVSERDRLLGLSELLAGGRPRAGAARNVEALRRMGVIVVDVSNFDDGTLGQHEAFQSSPELVSMIGSGELTRALQSGHAGDNIVIEAVNAVGAVVRAVAYLPYQLAR